MFLLPEARVCHKKLDDFFFIQVELPLSPLTAGVVRLLGAGRFLSVMMPAKAVPPPEQALEHLKAAEEMWTHGDVAQRIQNCSLCENFAAAEVKLQDKKTFLKLYVESKIGNV